MCNSEALQFERATNSQGRHVEFTDSFGYVWVTAPVGHPRASKKGSYRGRFYGQGYVKRAVLVAEMKIGRFLATGEVVHHANGVKNDDRPENLEVCLESDHSRWHCENTPPRRRINVPRPGDPCFRCKRTLSLAPKDCKRGLCNACYLRAKRERAKTGVWPAYATQFATTSGERTKQPSPH